MKTENILVFEKTLRDKRDGIITHFKFEIIKDKLRVRVMKEGVLNRIVFYENYPEVFYNSSPEVLIEDICNKFGYEEVKNEN